MTRPIGYYVHHHGDGHRQRALAIAAHEPKRIVLLGTGLNGRTGSVRAIGLPDDRMPDSQRFDGVDGTPQRPHALHYAPLNHDGVRSRMAMVAQWIAETRPALMVVDVSVEIALLARLCATPVAFVRLSGRRDDPAHCEAYRAASIVVAPFARQLDDPTLPRWVSDRTVYCPGISAARSTITTQISHRVLVVAGKGGVSLDGARIADAALATPEFDWRVIGPANVPATCSGNLAFTSWTDDAETEIARAQIVVGGAGDGLVNAVIAAAKPFVCIPEPRPFDEQTQKAHALNAAGAAVVLHGWPSASQWPAIFAQAMRLDSAAIAALGDPNGAANTLEILMRFADAQK